MIAIKQTLPRRVNTFDIKAEYLNKFTQITGWKQEECEVGFVKLLKGVTIMVVKHLETGKYLFITIGSSNKDVVVMERKGQRVVDNRYAFEYVLKADGSTFGHKSVKEIQDELENNNNPIDVLNIIFGVAQCAKQKNLLLLGGRMVKLPFTDKEFLTMTKDYETEESKHLALVIKGIPGKLRFVQIVVATKDEKECLDYLDDEEIANVVCVNKFINNNDWYSSDESNTFDFATIFNMTKFKADKEIKTLKDLEDLIESK